MFFFYKFISFIASYVGPNQTGFPRGSRKCSGGTGIVIPVKKKQQEWKTKESGGFLHSSSCHTNWLSHHLSPPSHCAALSLSCCASWLLHCLSPSSRCATLSSTRCASLLSHRLSSSSCCAPRHPIILSSCRLVVASPLDAPPSRCFVVLIKSRVVNLSQRKVERDWSQTLVLCGATM